LWTVRSQARVLKRVAQRESNHAQHRCRLSKCEGLRASTERVAGEMLLRCGSAGKRLCGFQGVGDDRITRVTSMTVTDGGMCCSGRAKGDSSGGHGWAVAEISFGHERQPVVEARVWRSAEK
jgi:hypothetical protein